MPQITDKQRAKRIQDLLAEVTKLPPEKHETRQLPPTKAGETLLCDVINIEVDAVLLNHDSHRLRSQLQDDPEWAAVEADPHGEAAQRILERKVREARTMEEFTALKDSLIRDGQTDPGVITQEGVLINANTRAVALRDIEDPTRRWIRVAVLPDTIHPQELALLELRMQMQKELKAEYSLTNELLFIEELSVKRHLSNKFIAEELRLPGGGKKAEAEVEERLQMLDLLRLMQRIPDQPLRLSFFDDPAHPLRYEQLSGVVLPKYRGLMDRDPVEADRYLESVLLSIISGVTAVHQIRKVDTAFMTDYMLPQLEEHETVGRFADALVAPDKGGSKGPAPKGVDLLETSADDDDHEVDVKRLINILSQRDKTVNVPGSSFSLERDEVLEAVKSSVVMGIKEKRQDQGADNKLQAPRDALSAATVQVNKSVDALKAVAGTPQFDASLKKSAEAAFKKFKRSVRKLEEQLAKSGVTS